MSIPTAGWPELATEYRGMLAHVARGKWGVPEDDVDDLIQETFARAWRRYQGRAVVEFSLIHRIARNLVIDRARHDGVLRIEPLLEYGEGQEKFGPAYALADPSSGAEYDEVDEPESERLEAVSRLVAEALAPLTPRGARALRLFHGEGRSMAAVGEALGINEEAAKSLVFRSKWAARRALGVA